MSRIIMLIPLNKNVGLTTISLSMIHFFNKNKSVQSMLYFSCAQNSLDNTSLIINKYFSKFVRTLNDINFSKVFFNSSKYFFLLNKIIDECHNKNILYDVILIEGMNNNYSINAEEMNCDISKNLNAEVIFISNLKDFSLEFIKKEENKINLFLKQKLYKNILGIIFNNINSPWIEKKYDFIKKLKILKQIKNNKKIMISTEIFKKKCFSVIGCIPWNKKILTTHVKDLLIFLNIKYISLIQKKNHIIEEIIIFDESHLNITNKNYLNILIIVPFSRINIFIDIFNTHYDNNKISCVIFTGVLTSKKYMISLCEILVQKSLSILFTEKNTIDILSKLQMFNFDIHTKDLIYIKKLQKYVSSFFSYSSLMIPKKMNNLHIRYSPNQFCYNLKLLSKKRNKRIILPESYETRILKAASICYESNIAQCVLLGDPKEIYRITNNEGINLNRNIEIINPLLIRDKYVLRLLEIRKEKGIDELSAKKQLENNTILGTLILESDQVDGLVSGSVNTTSDTVRPALQIIKTNSYSSLVSSVFFMLLPNKVLIYADCAININPTAEELAEIAIQSAESAKIFGIEPRIAMLSYSTGCSGFGYQVEKVKQATSIVRRQRSDLIIDGPIQYDAAVSETVSKLKAPFSPLSGSANIFVFPDLNSGNITYKAVQRSTKIVSIGPMLQGLRKPVNDLSRGASVEDIVYTIALTSIQSK